MRGWHIVEAPSRRVGLDAEAVERLREYKRRHPDDRVVVVTKQPERWELLAEKIGDVWVVTPDRNDRLPIVDLVDVDSADPDLDELLDERLAQLRGSLETLLYIREAPVISDGTREQRRAELLRIHREARDKRRRRL